MLQVGLYEGQEVEYVIKDNGTVLVLFLDTDRNRHNRWAINRRNYEEFGLPREYIGRPAWNVSPTDIKLIIDLEIGGE